MVKLVDTLVSNASAERRTGSTPVLATNAVVAQLVGGTGFRNQTV